MKQYFYIKVEGSNKVVFKIGLVNNIDQVIYMGEYVH